MFFFLSIIINPKPAIYHLHSYNFLLMIALIFRPFKSSLIFHEHSGRLVKYLPKIKKLILNTYLKKLDECVFVGEHIPAYYQENGITPPANFKIENSFLPPPLADEQTILDSYSPETKSFISSHFPLIVANAYKLVFYEGIDLYGLDMCVQLTAKLKTYFPDLGILFALAEIGDQKYFQDINMGIIRENLQNNFHFLLGQKELWPIFKNANLMIRPTYVDGFGVSVAEALYFNCPAIASNVCKRAEGTVYFENRNIDDLIVKVLEVINGTAR